MKQHASVCHVAHLMTSIFDGSGLLGKCHQLRTLPHYVGNRDDVVTSQKKPAESNATTAHHVHVLISPNMCFINYLYVYVNI